VVIRDEWVEIGDAKAMIKVNNAFIRFIGTKKDITRKKEWGSMFLKNRWVYMRFFNVAR